MMIIAATIFAASLFQVAPDIQDSAPVAPSPAPASASKWHAFSRSSATAYLVDLSSIVTTGDTTTIRVAKVPRDKAAPVDIAWRLEDIAVRCAAGEVKSLLNIEFAADGTEIDRYEGDDVWDSVSGSGYLGGIKDIACDGARAQGDDFPTLAAFMDSPR